MIPSRFAYVGGPYRGATPRDVDGYIYMAARALERLASLNVGAFCPHMNSAHFEYITPTVPAEYWLETDLYFLRHCDALVLVDGWRRSEGTLREVLEAKLMCVPIFDVSERPVPGFPKPNPDHVWKEIAQWAS